MCVCDMCLHTNVHVEMHTDTSGVNEVSLQSAKTLIINPQYILPPSLYPLIFKPQAALRGKFNPYMSVSFSFKSSQEVVLKEFFDVLDSLEPFLSLFS